MILLVKKKKKKNKERRGKATKNLLVAVSSASGISVKGIDAFLSSLSTMSSCLGLQDGQF